MIPGQLPKTFFASIVDRIFYFFLLFILGIYFFTSIGSAGRFYFSLSLDTVLVISFILTIVALPCIAILTRKQFILSPGVLPCFFVLLLVSFLTLFNSTFDGMASVGGGDAGTHLFLKRQFETSDPKVYQGFSALYFLLHLLVSKLNLGHFVSVQVVFWFVIFALVSCHVMLYGLVKARLPKDTKSRSVMPDILFLTFSLLIFYFSVLPELFYHQGEGFFAHVFGYPLFLVITILICSSKSALLAVGFPVLGFLIIRHTYGLNLADFVLTVFVCLIPFAKNGNRFRLSIRCCIYIVTFVFFCISLILYYKLAPLIPVTGGIHGEHFWKSTLGFLCWILVAIFIKNKYLKTESPTQLDGLNFVIWLAVIACLVKIMIQASGSNPQYYYYKYSMWAEFGLLSFVASSMALTFASIPTPVPRSLRILPALVVVLGLFLVNRGRSLRFSYFIANHLSSKSGLALQPYSDRKIETFIDKTLKANPTKGFGGMIVPYFGMSNFLNTSFDLGYHGYTGFFNEPTLKDLDKKCMFWLGKETELLALYKKSAEEPNFKALNALHALNSLPQTYCAAARFRWTPMEESSLCSNCMDR